MLVVHVDVHVKPESSRNSSGHRRERPQQRAEPGIARFDVIQDQADPTHFVLVEVYRTPDDPGRHKETAHYAVWRTQSRR